MILVESSCSIDSRARSKKVSQKRMPSRKMRCAWCELLGRAETLSLETLDARTLSHLYFEIVGAHSAYLSLDSETLGIARSNQTTEPMNS